MCGSTLKLVSGVFSRKKINCSENFDALRLRRSVVMSNKNENQRKVSLPPLPPPPAQKRNKKCLKVTAPLRRLLLPVFKTKCRRCSGAEGEFCRVQPRTGTANTKLRRPAQLSTTTTLLFFFFYSFTFELGRCKDDCSRSVAVLRL